MSDRATSSAADRAKRLFQFLARAQELKTQRVRSCESYTKDGSVQWLVDAPRHDAVTVAGRDGFGLEDAHDGLVISVRRVPKAPSPPVPPALVDWVVPSGDSTTEPQLLTVAAGQDDGHARTKARLEQHPAVEAAFNAWMEKWRRWADADQRDQPARDFYENLFRVNARTTGLGEEREFVLGVGLLSWSPSNHPSVKRHTFTVPVKIDVDDRTGRIDVSVDDSARGLTFEDDMLDPGTLPDRHILEKVQDEATSYEGHPLDREQIQALASTLINHLDASGIYHDDEERRPATTEATMAWAPALILRPRRDLGLVKVLDTIADHIDQSGVVPEGIMPLVDPDHEPATTRDPRPGAVLDVDGDTFSPLPLNAVQRQILDRVSQHAQTIVQGPPGTGKTHTAAALLSHLLAQGQRVLVTAHTDRALSEVRGKLPDEIKPLAVSVIGSSRHDMADLKVAVETISRTSSDFDHDDAERQIDQALTDVEELRHDRQRLIDQLIQARERETEMHRHLGYEGSLSQIAQGLQSEAATYEWIAPLAEFDGETPAPLTDQQAVHWCELLGDKELADDEPEAALRLATREIPDPVRFADACEQKAQADARVAQSAHLRDHAALAPIRAFSSDSRRRLREDLASLRRDMDALQLVGTQWMTQAVHDVRVGMSREWTDRYDTITGLLKAVDDAITFIGAGTTVTCPPQPGPLLPIADALTAHIRAHGALKLGADGAPKSGLFAPAPVKKAGPLFAQVTVNGRPPTTLESLDKFRAHVDALRLLTELDHAWPLDIIVPEEDTLHERASWHHGQHDQLSRVLELGHRIHTISEDLQRTSVPLPDWSAADGVTQLCDVIDYAAALEQQAAADVSLNESLKPIHETEAWADAAPAVHQLAEAARSHDPAAYARAHARHERLHVVRQHVTERDELTKLARDAAPTLAAAVIDGVDDPAWRDRLSGLTAAWAWANTRAWIRDQNLIDPNATQEKISTIERQLNRKAESIAAQRAWQHAVSADRITGSARSDLQQYSQLVRRLGKGTGKYAAKRRADIRDAMDRSRTAVPVWIMPIYRIAEQFDVTENMFDVVLVDEASQAGAEAVFLQFLAPKVVVIGDDKQVSPSAVGVDEDELRKLAARYLFDNTHIGTWQDPKHSLFDEAGMRFGSRLTLREHRRCVPEIIGFSNRIAYEPDGVGLLPVRQFGSARLEPLKQVLLDGHQEGRSGSKVNRAEARAVVDQIKTCCADTRYDGKTMGVISLLGRAQAELIESMLLEEISTEQWTARELRAGDAADFQGSERDVMFLSMVASSEPGSRLMPQTTDSTLQRFNVAASRAKDQMWLFHSVALTDLPNHDDMRHQLVAYIEETRQDGALQDEAPAPVSDVDRAEPFRSLFEQHVYNRLVERGYAVQPQLDISGYRIDLVVIGAGARLAVECNGDQWSGLEQYRSELASQRDLQRCGWEFFHIRESAFHLDPDGVIDALEAKLALLGIEPAQAQAQAQADTTTSAKVVDGHIQHGQTPAATTTAEPSKPEASNAAEPSPADDTETADTRMSAATEASHDQENCHTADGSNLDELQRTLDSLFPDEAREHSSSSPKRASGTDVDPAGRLNEATILTGIATPEELIDGLMRIASAQEPISGEQLRDAYAAASGENLTREGMRLLNSALWTAKRKGLLVTDNAPGVKGVSKRIFRLPGSSRRPSPSPRVAVIETDPDDSPAQAASDTSPRTPLRGHETNEIGDTRTGNTAETDQAGADLATASAPERRSGLFAWQREAVEAWRTADRIGVVQAVTGAGKTRVGLAAIAEARAAGKRCVVMVPTRALVDQWTRELKVAFPDDWVTTKPTAPAWDILATTVHSLTSRRALRLGERGLLVADECHRYGAPTFARALREEFDWRLGLSATFEREDTGDGVLHSYFNGICYDLGYGRARQDDVIAPFRFTFAAVPFTAREREEYDEWDQACHETLRVLQTRFDVPETPFSDAMKAIQEIAKDRSSHGRGTARYFLKAFAERRRLLAETHTKQAALTGLASAVRESHGTLIFTQTQRSAIAAAQLLAEQGCASSAIHSGLNDQERIYGMSQFRDGSIRALSAPRILDEGVDVPAADLGIVMASNRSRRQMVQRLGRILRKKSHDSPARFVVLYVSRTVEDPLARNHLPDFYDLCLPHAEQVDYFDLETDGIAGLLRSLGVKRPVQPSDSSSDRAPLAQSPLIETDRPATSPAGVPEN